MLLLLGSHPPPKPAAIQHTTLQKGQKLKPEIQASQRGRPGPGRKALPEAVQQPPSRRPGIPPSPSRSQRPGSSSCLGWGPWFVVWLVWE